MIETLSFHIEFPKFGFEKSCSFSEGLHVIYGESGTGKSSFINQLIQQNPRESNFIILQISGNNNIQKVFQNPDTQIVSSTLAGELAFSLECISNETDEIKKKSECLKNELMFKNDNNRHPSTLSGGEKEMLNIVTAFSVNPECVFIDDGLSFLNPKMKRRMVEYIKGKIANKNMTVLWFTSDSSDLNFGESRWELNLSSFDKIDKPIVYQEFSKGPLIKTGIELICSHVSFSYNNHQPIFHNLDFNAKYFQCLGITGENGKGKTTLANLILGMETPCSGSISVCKTSTPIPMAYLDQFPERLVGGDIMTEFVQKLISAGKFEPRMKNYFIKQLTHSQIIWEQVKDKPAWELPWSTLRILLTILLLNCNYECLILDEPTFGLGRSQILNLTEHLQRYLKNKQLIIISHDNEFISAFCDQIYDLDENKLKHNFQSSRLNINR